MVRSNPKSINGKNIFEIAIFFNMLPEKNKDLITKFIENSVKAQ